MITRQDIYFENYKKRGRNPQSWFSAGRMNHDIGKFLLRKYINAHKILLHDAEKLDPLGQQRKQRLNFHDLNLHKHVKMFFGLSLECYLKGMLIKNGKDSMNTKNSIPCLDKYFVTHDLIKLFKDFWKREPSTKEKGILANLIRAIKAAKYPVELKADNSNAISANFDSDVKIAESLIHEIEQMLTLRINREN